MEARQDYIPVNLCNKVDIAKSLSRVVSSSFGPSCLQTMLTTSTGTVLVTSQGIAILKSLQISHPVARLIVSAVTSHHSSVADGTKTMILLLEHSLQVVQDIIDKQASSHLGSLNIQQQMNNYLSNKIASALGKFSNTVLPEIFIGVQEKADMLNADCCKNALKHRMFSVLTTAIASHFSSAMSKYFATLLLEYVIPKSGLQNLESLNQTIGFILDNFEFIHVKSPGQGYKESSVINGFLLQRNFSFLSDHLADAEIKCVLLKCPVEGVLSTDNATVRLKSRDTIQVALELKQKNAKFFLQSLCSNGVTLIISTEMVPDYVISLCQKLNISVVSCADEEDIQFLEKISGKFVIHNTWDDVDDSVIVHLSECRRFPVGCQIYIQIGFEKELPKQLILCAPTDGMCHQLGNIVYKGFKSLSFCFQESSTSCQNASSNNTAINLVNKSAAFSSTSIDSLTINSLDNDSSMEDPTIMNHGSPLDDRGTCVICNGISLDSCDTTTNTHKMANSSKDILPFTTFPGGGYFEYVLAELLEQRMKICANQEIAWCCQILAKSLRAVPFVLYKNLSQDSSARSFIVKDLEIRTAVRNNCVAGFNSRGCVCDPVKGDILEPPLAKFAVLNGVIQLLQQLLKIDGIVGVRSLPT